MKTLSNFFEDIEQRRQALAQRRADQLSSFKEKGAAQAEKRQEVLNRQRERINDLNQKAKEKEADDKARKDAEDAEIDAKLKAERDADEAEAEKKEEKQRLKAEIKKELAKERRT